MLWCWVGLWIASHSRLCINGASESGRLRDVCVCQWVKAYKHILADDYLEMKLSHQVTINHSKLWSLLHKLICTTHLTYFYLHFTKNTLTTLSQHGTNPRECKYYCLQYKRHLKCTCICFHQSQPWNDKTYSWSICLLLAYQHHILTDCS